MYPKTRCPSMTQTQCIHLKKNTLQQKNSASIAFLIWKSHVRLHVDCFTWLLMTKPFHKAYIMYLQQKKKPLDFRNINQFL